MVANLKPKITDVVSTDVPSFFNESYPNFVKFLEYYYDWMEDNGNALEFIRNVLEQHDYDLADDQFRSLIDQSILKILPEEISVDKKILVKNIRDILRTKGTEDSFQFLLNAVFGEKSTLAWGKDFYIKSSDSVVNQQNVICIRHPELEAKAFIAAGEISHIRLLKNDVGFYAAPDVIVTRSEEPSDTNIPDITVVLSGHVVSASIKNPGINMASVNITVNGAADVTAEISAVLSGGQITGLTVDNPGSGYQEKPTVTVTGTPLDPSQDFGDAEIEIEWTAVIGNIIINDGKIGHSVPPRLELIGGQDTKEQQSGNDTIVIESESAAISFTIDGAGTVNGFNIDNPGENYYSVPTQKWTLQPPEDAVLEATLAGDKISGVRVIHPGTYYVNEPTISFSTPQYDYTKLEGQRIVQKGDNYATAIVDNVFSYLFEGETYYVLTLQKEGLKGTFNPDTIITSADESVIAINTALFSDIDVQIPGSGYRKGDIVNFIGEGTGGKIKVNDVSSGSVDDLIITKSGTGYAVGEKIVASGNAIGSNFEAEITDVDGSGAKFRYVMEIDEINIVDSGSDYQIGDELLIYGGAEYDSTPQPKHQLAKGIVTSLVAADNIKAIAVDKSSYARTNQFRHNIAILPDPSSNVPLRQLTYYGEEFENGTFVRNFNAVTTTDLESDNIRWLPQTLDLGDALVVAILNGANAVVSINETGGVINGINFSNVGINYVEPKLKYSGGSGADIDLVTNKYGSLFGSQAITSGTYDNNTNKAVVTISGGHGLRTNETYSLTIAGCTPVEWNATWTVVAESDTTFAFFTPTISGAAMTVTGTALGYVINSGGSGYGGATATVVETFDNKIILDPLMETAGIGSIELSDRGEFIEIDKESPTAYRVFGGSGSNVELDIYYRVKYIEVLDPGRQYNEYNLIVGEGHGSGAIVSPTVKDDVITGLTLTNGGSGYSYAKIVIDSSTGFGFNANVDISGGVITGITIIDGGSGYDSLLDTISVLGDGTGAVIDFNTVEDGVITSIDILNGGSGYHYDCRLKVGVISGTFSQAGTLVAVTATNHGYSTSDNITMTFSNGSPDLPADGTYSITVTNENVFTFLVADSRTRTGDVDATQFTSEALYNPVFENGKLVDVELTSGGAGYSLTRTYAEVFYLETSTDIDPHHVLFGVDSVANGHTYQYGNTYKTVTAGSWTGGTATMTVASHGYTDAEYVMLINCVPSGYNGTYAISGSTVDTFDVSIASDPGSFTSGQAILVARDATNGGDNVFTASGMGHLGFTLPVVDFVDAWTQDLAYPKEAQHHVATNLHGNLINLQLTDQGTGYFADWEREPLSLVVTGDGTSANLKPILKDGAIHDVIILDGGENYTTATVATQGGKISGTDATFIVGIENGVITRVIIDNGGTGYYYGTSVEVFGDGSFGAVEAVVDTGITRTITVHEGEGYLPNTNYFGTFDFIVTDNNPTNTQPGTGASIVAIIEEGKIADVIIQNPGVGYYDPVLTIPGGVSGTGGDVDAFADRKITELILTNPGINYTSADILITGDGIGAKGSVDVSDISIAKITTLYQGNRYSRVPEIKVEDTSGVGAISEVKIINGGKEYRDFPTLTVETASGSGGEVVAWSDTIGKVSDVRFDEFSFGSDDIPLVQFPIVAIVPENAVLKRGEMVYVKDYDYPNNDYTMGPHGIVRHIDYDKNLLTIDNATDDYIFITENGDPIIFENEDKENQNKNILHEISYPISVNDVLVGVSSENEAKLLRFSRAAGTGVMSGFGRYPLKLESSQSVPSNSKFKANDNQRFQDFAYIIRTGLDLEQYKTYVKKLTHIAGYSMWGDIDVQTFLQAKTKLPVDEETGQQLFDIIVLTLALQSMTLARSFKDWWRLEQYSVTDLFLVNKTLEEIEEDLEAGIDTNITWPSEVTIKGAYRTFISDATWAAGTATITSTSHGLSNGDQIKLTNITPSDWNEDVLTVANATADTFEVSIASDPGAYVTGGEVITLGDYVLSGNSIDITFPGHGLAVGDRLFLEFFTGGAYDNYYTVETITDANNFSVVKNPHKYMGTYTGDGSTNVYVTLKEHKGYDLILEDDEYVSHTFTNGDTIDVTDYNSNTPTFGAIVDGSYTVASSNTSNGTFSFVNGGTLDTSGNPTSHRFTILIEVTSTSGVVEIQKIKERACGSNYIRNWVEGTEMNMNDIVEVSHGLTYLVVDTHIATQGNRPNTDSHPASTISNATWSGGVATFSTTTAHGMVAQDEVLINEVDPAGFNGTYTVLNVTSNTIDVALAANPGAYNATDPKPGLAVRVTEDDWEAFANITAANYDI